MGMRDQGWWCRVIHVVAGAVGCLLLLGLSGWVQGQSAPGISNVRFRNYSVAEGLPQASITAMAQDSRGFLWFGTQAGVVRFNGYEFRVYQHDPEQPDSLANNHITALLAGDHGDVWVGTQNGGLDHYLPGGDRFEHYRAGQDESAALASDTVYALARDSRGRIWIATLGSELQWLDSGSGDIRATPLGKHKALKLVRALLPLPDGSMLVGGSRGLWRVDAAGRGMRSWTHEASGLLLDVYALARGPEGGIWVSTSAQGLYHFDDQGRLVRHYLHRDGDPGSLPDNQVRGLHFDRQGRLWIAGETRGLARLDPGSDRFKHFPHDPADPQSVASNRLWSVGGTRSGMLLVGSWSNGLSIHDPATEAFTQIVGIPDDPRALPVPGALSVYADADGTLWAGLGQGGGLVHIDLERGVIRRYRHDPDNPASLSRGGVTSVVRGPAGALWAATDGGGLNRLRADGSGFEHVRHDSDDVASLGSNQVGFLYFDHAGTMWVATDDAGLYSRCVKCSEFHHYGSASYGPGVHDIEIARVLATRDGTVWMGARGTGLYRLEPGEERFKHVTEGDASGLSSSSVTAIFQDSRGELWVGTQGGGLNHALSLHPLRFEVIDKRTGLNSNAIGEILEDAKGNIWVSTIEGISRIQRDTLKVRNFAAHDGASELGYWVNSGTRLPDGRLVFGGLDAITVVDAAAIQAVRQATPALTALVLRGHRFAFGARLPEGVHWDDGTLALGYRHNDFGVEFASLDFAAPDSLRYAYSLTPGNQAWIRAPASRRLAIYTNLDPGHYRLRVRARHPGGAWSDPVASMRIVVAPAPWASPPAYAAYAGLLLLLVGGSVWRIRARLSERQRVQETIRASEERLKLALWGSGSEMWEVDLRAGSMRLANRLPNTAVTRDNVGPELSSYLPYLHPQDRADFDRAFGEHLAGRADSFEASFRTLGGDREWIWLLSRGRVVERGDDGRAVRVSGTTTDINALKQAEASLRALNESLESRVEERTAAWREANEELRRALQRLTEAQEQLLETEKLAALGSLVAGVAHEINTPLGVGVTAASYLNDEASRLARQLAVGPVSSQELKRFSEQASEGAQIILQNLRRADQLVKSFKQVAVEQSNDDVRVVDLGACVNDIINTLGPTLRRGAHQLQVHCPEGLTLNTSPGALYQVITNLIVNSVTHGFEHDAPGRIDIELSGGDGGVLLEYRDDGKGMSDAVLVHVYEPFFTTRRGHGGSGLGMHIVYNLVTQALKGRIGIESAPGAGVRVRIHLSDLDPPVPPSDT